VDLQVLFNIAVGAVGALGGFLLHTVWDELKMLKQQDTKLAEKVAAIEVLVAGQYVTRDEFSTHINALFKKLDTIADKLDRKADK
jgi:hypothetical protein